MSTHTAAVVAEKDAEIARLHIRIRELEEALRPFADAADAAERALCKHNTDEILIRLGRLREARAILAKSEAA